jgi:phospholipase C
MDHVVVVLFENRSFDNLFGRLYRPGEVPTFEGVIDKDLRNPIPAWAEHGSELGTVAYDVAKGMDSPDPDPGEEYPHTNTQLFNVLDDANRFRDATQMVAPFNAPAPGQAPTMDGFVSDYISFFTVEMGRQPTFEEYRQIMAGYTPEQIPVLSTIARGFGVFDHWFSDVPSQTLTNRSFWTAATSSGFVVNRPTTNFIRHNRAETIFDRLEQNNRTWKVYVLEPSPISFTGLIHAERLRPRFATNFVPFAEFERDAAEGRLPDFSFIEPNLLAGHGDYHRRSTVVDPRRRGVPCPDLRCYSLGTKLRWLERLQHELAHWLGRTGRNLRPCAARTRPTARSLGTSRRARIRLRPLRLPSPGGARLALDCSKDRIQRGVPAYLAHCHPPRRLEARGAID